ncbi:MAG: hypothetical protein ACI9MR_004370 [Myxococcota bacterium]|jgi:hypothetical protein
MLNYILTFAIALLLAGPTFGCSSDDGGNASPDTAADTTATPDATVESCGVTSPEALAACVERSRIEADVTTVAKPRPPGSVHWQAVQDLCAARFAAAGFDVVLDSYGGGVNVIGTKLGTSHPDELVVLGAHYDHIADCDGADDNGSGVAALFESARVLGTATHDRTVVVACWDQEERGLIGSTDWVMRASWAATPIALYLNFETMGYTDNAPQSQTFPPGFDLVFAEAAAAVEANESRGDFITAIANEQAAPFVDTFKREGERAGVPVVDVVIPQGLIGSSAIGDLRRSDHAGFWDEGYPAIFFTDTANFRNPNYHCGGGANTDTADTLDYDFLTRVVQASVATAADSLVGGEPLVRAPHSNPGCTFTPDSCEGAQKCSLRRIDGVTGPSCVDAGALGVGDDCTREELGIDACGAGLICAGFGQVGVGDQEPARVCTSLCEADGCEGDTWCINFGYVKIGACVAACDPFALACGEGLRCSPFGRVGTEAPFIQHACTQTRGDVALDGDCNTPGECVDGLTCGIGTCRPICDAEHPCPDGASCPLNAGSPVATCL